MDKCTEGLEVKQSKAQEAFKINKSNKILLDLSYSGQPTHLE